MSDRYELARFTAAQERDGTYERALGELRAGRKRSHWMWFVFPQLAGLGSSATSRTYAISSLSEACEYLAHPVLGARLSECIGALLDASGKSAREILGDIDAIKLRSSMTLFAHALREQCPAAADPQPFERVLAAYFDGEPDPATEALLGGG